MGHAPGQSRIGDALLRLEDDSLLRGAGRFLDDIHIHDSLEAAFLRSPVAHGLIRRIDTSAARALEGVYAVLIYSDLRPLLTSDHMPLALPAGGLRHVADPDVLAREEVCYVGEPIVLVIAQTRALAEDAIGLIELDIDPLPAISNPADSLKPGAAQVRRDCPDNLVAQTFIDYGNADSIFAEATHVIKQEFRLSKGGGHSMEGRGVLASFDEIEKRLTVWNSTQMPHRAKAILVDALGLRESQVRVVTPDVGGGFGPKAVFHPEELAVPAAALLLKRPVKWVEDRYEAFVATCGERDQIWTMEVAFDAQARLQAIRGRLQYDHGAATPYGIALPYNAATNLIGPYILPAYKIQIDLCLTNITPSAPTRGAGRPQGTFVMERLLDRMAKQLGLSRDEVRRRNLIKPEQMPFPIPVRQRDGSTMEYDTGDYPQSQSRALAAADWDSFPDRQKAARREGRFLGLGLSNYVEATGRGPFESVNLRIGPSGEIVASTGATAQGQGVNTMIAQIIGDVLRTDARMIHVNAGDTAATPSGLGAYASRQAVTAGNAAHQAALLIADKIKIAAAALFEAAPDDIELNNGYARVKGIPGHEKSFADIARALGGTPGFALPGNLPPGLSAASDFMTSGLTYTNGTHVAEVEVDPATGGVKILRYIVVHDCGRMINPLMVEGQVRGGIVHGIGATLYEWMRYDSSGQPLTVNFADYLLPTADVAPKIEIHHMESPTPLNPLGVKGAAESGTIGAPAVIVSAIENALSEFGVELNQLPITPSVLHDIIWAQEARQQREKASG